MHRSLVQAEGVNLTVAVLPCNLITDKDFRNRLLIKYELLK